jgi:serine/threonine protein kinase
MLSPETILQGRYRIVRQLGQGGMGAVYEAIDQRLDTVVALKETLFTDEKLRKQFEREARLLARLHHQALPRVSDHFTEGEGQFLVMQYIPGEDLFEMQARRQGAFPQAEVLRWADQLCDALDYLHTQEPQIIHRDIKPQNLKLTARGQIVLLDFGLAKGYGGQMSVVTTSASIFGYTPNYAPLEQVQGLGTDPRSDIYSLAATLYHLLTNVKPPDALSRAGAIVNGMPDPLAPADSVSPQISPSVARVLQTAMSQKRDDRYTSAQVMREGLQAAATGSLGEMPTVLTGTGATNRADTVAPAAGTQVAAQQTSGFTGEAKTLLADEATRVRNQTVSPDTATAVHSPPPRARSKAWLVAPILMLLIVAAAAGFFISRARKAQTGDTPPVTQNPVAPAQPTPVESAPISSTSTAESTTTTTKADSARQRAKQTETATKPTPLPVTDSAARNPNPQPNPNPNTERPKLPPPTNNPVGHPPDVPRPQDDTRTRTFPNGTRMEKRPDGTTVVTFPDGRTRVFPPGMMPPNRRRKP